MAVQNYENIDINSDVSTTRTLLHEVIPVTGTILSGAYGTWPNDTNIKNYSHGMFQSVYDYPYLSSSANHIFDLTVGYDETSALSSSAATQNTKKINLYNQFSQLLLGYTGSTTDGVRKFESDLTLDGTGTMKDVFFINFARLLTKDQIKKGTFSITLGTGSWSSAFAGTKTLSDVSASNTGETTNTFGGDYGVLFESGTPNAHGVLFYQAGIAVISSSIFSGVTQFDSGTYGYRTAAESLHSSSISGACDVLRHRVQTLSYNNTTEINSKIYFCRVPHNKFNYSSNPTYLSGSKIRVKEVATDPPVSYITTIGLYNSANELLATAKLSEPLRKDPTQELILRVRLDY